MEQPKLYFKKKFYIPIYDSKLWVVVTDSIKHERQAMNKTLGKEEPGFEFHDTTALCSRYYNNYALFFDKQYICINIVAHEVFHLTHRIMEYVSANFDHEHHEQGAMLHGYLMDLVYRAVREYIKPCLLPSSPS